MDENVSNAWMVRVPSFFNVSHIRELMQQGSPLTPIYGFRHRAEFANRDYHDIDVSENRENEADLRLSLDELLHGAEKREFHHGDHGVSDQEQDSDNVYAGLSGDSLAFTLVYVSVFTLTLLYVGVRLARRWRKKHRATVLSTTLQGIATGSDESLSQPAPVPPCGHPQCARAAVRAAAGAGLLPGAYTWIPAMAAAVHNTASCRGRCAACRQLSQPPPSYTKLFLEDQPPAYHDSLVIKDDDDSDAANECTETVTDECRDTINDVVIQMEDDPELLIQADLLQRLENTPLSITQS